MARTPPERLLVPLLDLQPQYRSLQPDIDAALLRVAASQRFILGPAVDDFERRIAAYCGARHAIGMSSGTDAILAALMALGIGPGDAVVTTPYTFFATAGAVARLGARPLFVDIEPATCNIDPAAVERLLEADCDRRDGDLVHRGTGARVRALLPVHLFGHPADMDRLGAAALRARIAIIEDAAQAIGAEWHARRVGSIGDMGCFSFFPTKNLGAFGDAGMVTTNDDALAARLRQLRVHGMEPRYHHALIGGNFRIDEIQAAVLGVKLAHLDGWTAARQRRAAFYADAFGRASTRHAVRAPRQAGNVRHVFNQYVIRVRDRDALKAFLAAAGVGTEIYYPVPLHLQECFANLGHRAGDFPAAELAAAESLALPVWPELADEQARHVVDSIVAFFR